MHAQIHRRDIDLVLDGSVPHVVGQVRAVERMTGGAVPAGVYTRYVVAVQPACAVTVLAVRTTRVRDVHDDILKRRKRRVIDMAVRAVLGVVGVVLAHSDEISPVIPVVGCDREVREIRIRLVFIECVEHL